MSYIDGFLIPVPAGKKEAYRDVAAKAAMLLKEFGATRRMTNMPATVVSSTLTGPLSWPNATLVNGDAVEIIARLKKKSKVPLRSHGSISLNRASMAAGLVDFVRVTVFPVISGKTGTHPIFKGAADFDLEMVENRTLDRNIQELIYRPTLHV